MKLQLCALATVLALGASAEVTTNPQSVTDLLNRIGGTGTSDRFEIVVDDSYGSADAEKFQISANGEKPCIKGTTLSAVTTGIGWYLNHYANVNLAWNNLTTDLSQVSFPVPAATEEHTTSAIYRYYLNYCTFSYSMSTWTWERWQQEIDWMALHGINLPLQIVGLEEVWRKLLTEDYGYTKDEANDFVGGPSFMAWFAMNNLEGHGGPNPDWWYERQANLGKQINERMKSLGIEPVLPGFAGMVPSNFTSKTGISANSQGEWCGFLRPYILVTTTDDFKNVAAKYYQRLEEVMGTSEYYSIDPFHEGGSTGGVDGKVAYKAIYDAMNTAVPDSKWVIQQWQWSATQWLSVADGVIPQGKLIVLDLNADAIPGNLGGYNGHHTVYSTIFNFGGRTGFFGRFNGIIDGYFDNKANIPAIKGIGAAPEAIEQTPVMYDLLFELPWLDSKPDPAEWMAEYSKRRYSADVPAVTEAWELLRTSALDCRTGLQGPHEAIMCARPALTVNSVSSWGGSEIFYDQTKTASAAYKLMGANLSGENYSYDLTDIVRQAITDYSKSLLAGIKEANDNGDTEVFNSRRDAFLQLMLDVDRLLNTNKDFMIGHWTERARAMADEVVGTTEADRDWLEHQNARTIITTWADTDGSLHDYSYRQWGGILQDLYYERWKQWFDNGMGGINCFNIENAWAKTDSKRYPTAPTGSTAEVAKELLEKYLSPFNSTIAGQETRYIQRMLSTDLRGQLRDRTTRGNRYAPDFTYVGAEISDVAIDWNKNTVFEESEISNEFPEIPADAAIGEYTVRIRLTDGTELQYTLSVIEEITEPRTVTVASEDETKGSVSIDGTDELSVTGMDFYVVRAKATPLYDFSHWTDSDGNELGNDNPMTYYGKEDISLTAHFVENKWGVPDTDYSDKSTIDSYRQWVASINLVQNGESSELYSTESIPDEQFIVIPTRIKAAPGGELSLNWTDAGGLSYLYVSAYADLNSDGTFSAADGELIATLGNHESANNTDVANGRVSLLLPFDAAIGTTHMRLRFDSSWFSPWDASTGAVAADARVTRYVYEFLLEVGEHVEYPATVTCSVNNSALGSIRSENMSTNIYTPGEEVIITAFPAAGARLVKFVDNHGRDLPAEWYSNENAVRFKAYDNAHITAVFEQIPLDVDGWSLEWEESGNGNARVTKVAAAGDPSLDLSRASAGVTIDEIEPSAFSGNEVLAEITLPESRLMAPQELYYSFSVEGSGRENDAHELGRVINGNEPWVLVIEGTTGSDSFNQYGSVLWANGTNGLANDYSGGWSQFYLTRAGTLDIKWDSSSTTSFGVNLLGEFKIKAEFDGANTLTVTVSNASGETETKTITNSSAMQNISQYVTCIPEGMDYAVKFFDAMEPAVLGDLFRNCSSLTDIHLAAGNDSYAEEDGVIYSLGGSAVIAYPEGRLHRLPFTISDAQGNVLTHDGSVSVFDASPANSYHALWTLTDGGLYHLNAAKRVCEAEYSLLYGSAFPEIYIFNGDQYLKRGSEGSMEFSAGAEALSFSEPLTSLAYEAPAGYSSLALPLPVVIPDDVACFRVCEVSADYGVVIDSLPVGSVIPSVSGLLVKSETPQTVMFRISSEESVDAQDVNLLKGATLRADINGYVVSDNRFSKATVAEANTAYLDVDDMGEFLEISDRETALDRIEAADSADLVIYDLQGRRVSGKPIPGIYLTNKGTKIHVK